MAPEGTTCLSFSAAKPTAYEGRGEVAALVLSAPAAAGPDRTGTATCIDVGAFVRRKLEAMAAHRSHFAFDPDMLPLSITKELFGREYFVRAYPATEP